MVRRSVRTSAAVLFIFLLAGSGTALGAGRYASDTIGLGLSLGSPTGLDAKFGLGDQHAINATLGIHFLPHDSLGLGIEYDYAFYNFKAGPTSDQLYVGLGVTLSFLHRSIYGHHHKHHDDDDSGFGIGVRVPFGVEFTFDRAPINLFAEVAPGLGFVRHYGLEFMIDVAIGFRFVL